MKENQQIAELKIECNSVKAGQRSSLGVMIELNAPKSAEAAEAQTVTRTPKGIVFVVDRSGSMGGGRLEMVKNTILDIIGRLNKDDFLSIVTFDHAVDIVQPLESVGKINLQTLRRTIGRLMPGGNTNLEQGYRFGLGEAAKALRGTNVNLILLSDGKANAGLVEPTRLGQIAAQATEHMISTSTIGIGEAYDEKALVAIATTGHGNHFAGISQDEAAFGLAQEVDGLLSTTMHDVRINLTLKGDLGRQFLFKSIQPVQKESGAYSVQTFHIGDMASLEERNYVFDLKLNDEENIRHADTGELIARIEYTDAATGIRHLIEKSQPIKAFDPRRWIEPARNEDIVMELATLRAQEAKEEAIRLMRAGREAEARAHLIAIGADLEELEVMSAGMSNRNRMRAQMAREEFNEMALMDSESFIKRGEESVKRGRESKPDPRKRQQGDA